MPGAPGSAAVGLVLGAQQVVQDVDDGRDVPLGLPVGILEGRVEGAGEGAGVDALPVVVHRLDDRPSAVCSTTLPALLLKKRNSESNSKLIPEPYSEPNSEPNSKPCRFQL